jgi:CheY-like chemotaxis protein
LLSVPFVINTVPVPTSYVSSNNDPQHNPFFEIIIKDIMDKGVLFVKLSDGKLDNDSSKASLTKELSRHLSSSCSVNRIGADDNSGKHNANWNDLDLTKGLDWVLTNYDIKTSEAQSLDEELERLQVLRSYLILDSERELPFERLTALASRIMDVPIALVSLVDLGRQWFMSNRGLGECRETPRDQAFCAHTIVTTEDLLVVPNTTEDPRFANNPFVTGPPYIRFYAGAPLVAPEGYKLGTFCVIDIKPRPEGLDFETKQNLRELGAMVVEVLVTRRRKRERDANSNAELIACTAHDMLTPLSGIELSLSLLRGDEDFNKKLSKDHKECVERASTYAGVVQDICNNVRETFGERRSAFEISSVQAQVRLLNVDSLVNKMYTIMEPFPKQVPLSITVDPNVPSHIVSDESKIFRCAVNFLTIACSRTHHGSVKLRIFVREQLSDKKPKLVVECEDTGPAVDLDMYKHLFKPVSEELDLLTENNAHKQTNGGKSTGVIDPILKPGMGLFSVATQMNEVGGKFGFRPRGADANGSQQFDENGKPITGSLFWFSVTFSRSGEGICVNEVDVLAPNKVDLPQQETTSPLDTSMMADPGGVRLDRQLLARKKRALIIEDSTVVRKMLKQHLAKLGFDVSEAVNGMEGLKELKGSLFDLILCDFLMPVMDGLDCVQQYRDWEKDHRSWFTHRIIGISAHASESDVEKGLNVGMDEFKRKPVTSKQLSEMQETAEQVLVSKRLDDIETAGNVSWGSTQLENAKNNRHSDEERVHKRMKLDPGFYSSKVNKVITKLVHTCLIITPTGTGHAKLVEKSIKMHGWQATIAHNYDEALHLMKMRTWNVVLLDEGLAAFLPEFREWEAKNRSDQQKNVMLMSESIVPEASGPNSFIKPPEGFGGVVGKPVCVNSLISMLGRVEGSSLISMLDRVEGSRVSSAIEGDAVLLH